MMITKKRFEKIGGRVAFHGYQSFAPGEGTPEMVHEIGVKLANELWGDRFEIVVATHLDKENHLHTHFVINSVSFADGKRFVCRGSDYMAMRNVSDRLCREYGLSVIEKPQPGKSKQYAEWSAEQNGKPTWRSTIKTDIDEAIRASMSDTQMYNHLKQKGYEVKIGKDISVRPPGKERFFRLARNFGDDYTKEAIKERILSQRSPARRQPVNANGRRCRYRRVLKMKQRRKIGGILGLYLHYRYLLGSLPKRNHQNAMRTYFMLREDITHLKRISEETKLLCRHHIETDEQLFSFRDDRLSQIDSLSGERNEIRAKLRSQKYADHHDDLRTEAAIISAKLKDLRKEVRLAGGIAERSGIIRGKIKIVKESEKQGKENMRNANIIRSR